MDVRSAWLEALVERGFSGPSWHGTSLKGTLRGLTPEVAGWVPGDGRRSIWELLLHAAYWKYIVRRALTAVPESSFGKSPANWPALPDERTPKALKADIAFLVGEHTQLARAIGDFDAARWDEPAHTSGMAYAAIVEGVAFHDIHHGGQIQLLKRLAPPS
jgi:hypothetical protein